MDEMKIIPKNVPEKLKYLIIAEKRKMRNRVITYIIQFNKSNLKSSSNG